MVVLAIIGLLVSFAIPAINKGSSGVELRAAARTIAAGLARARTDAIFQGREVLFAIDVDARRFGIEGTKPVNLPAELDVTVKTAESEIYTRSRAAIRFYPDGSSTGGAIRIAAANNNDRKELIAIDWLTGRVSIVE